MWLGTIGGRRLSYKKAEKWLIKWVTAREPEIDLEFADGSLIISGAGDKG